MQMAVGEEIEKGHNVFVTAPTGSGKTLAFLLPLIHSLETLPEDTFIRLLVLLPTRELAQQCRNVFEESTQTLRSEVIHGGRPVIEESRRIEINKPQVIFATPGRLTDHLRQTPDLLQHLRYFIVDEYDKCLELGFKAELQTVVSALPEQKLQYVFTSATPLYDEALRLFHLDAEHVMFLDYAEDVSNRLSQYYVAVRDDDDAKLSVLSELLRQERFDSCIIFATHKEDVEMIAKYLRHGGFDVAAYHGGLTQEQRERAIFRFEARCVNILIATDIAARGLDFPQVDLIIHFHPPVDQKSYQHRVGRTLRWENCGRSVLFLPTTERLPEYIQDIKEYPVGEVPHLKKDKAYLPKDVPYLSRANASFSALYIGRGKKEGISRKDVLGFLCNNANINAKDIGKIHISAHFSLVALPKEMIDAVLAEIQGKKIKKQQTIYEKLRH